MSDVTKPSYHVLQVGPAPKISRQEVRHIINCTLFVIVVYKTHNSLLQSSSSNIKMPRQSHRHKAISAARKKFKAATSLLFLAKLVDDDDSIAIDLTDPDPVVASFLSRFTSLNRLRKSRYSQKRTYRKSKLQDIFEDDLFVSDDGNHWLNDNEFKRKYRCSREALDKITAKIEGNDVFKKGTRGPNQLPVKHQLMCLLHFLGQEGESNAGQRNQFKVSYGATELYRKRVVQALGDLRKQYIKWPDESERKEIANCIEKQFLLPNCLGLMDGTLLPLGIAPISDDSADYHGHKFPYALTVLVINDDKRRIRAYLSGYPGSTHDNRLWRNMKQNQQAHNIFWETLPSNPVKSVSLPTNVTQDSFKTETINISTVAWLPLGSLLSTRWDCGRDGSLGSATFGCSLQMTKSLSQTSFATSMQLSSCITCSLNLETTMMRMHLGMWRRKL